MKHLKYISFIIVCVMSYGIQAQCFIPSEPYLYAAPIATGDGLSYSTPMDLQTALNTIQPGYTLWLLNGIYNGRYNVPASSSGTSTCPITISSYPGEWAKLDGNNNPGGATNVLTIRGAYIYFKDFEITHLGAFTRDQDDLANFESCGGISHLSGVNCKFINLVIHDNPGIGFGTWKSTAGTEIYGCMIYNNGWYESNPPTGVRYNHGPAFYAQNASEEIRLLENNIVFNNFSFAYEIWSACSSGCNGEYVKNITVNKSSIFNNAHPFQNGRHQILVSSADQDGINVPRDVIINENEIYNNHDLEYMAGYGGSIRLNESNSPNAMQNITITNNFMIGKNQALVIGNVESLTYTGNFLATGLINMNGNSQHEPYPNWTFLNNTYFNKWPPSSTFMREVLPGADFNRSFPTWQGAPFFKDAGSEKFRNGGSILPLKTRDYTSIVQNVYNPNKFKVAVFDGNANNVDVNFFANGYDIPVDTPYTIIDVENYPYVMTSGTMGSSGVINFEMDSTTWIEPQGEYGTWTFEKTPSTFGVFLIEFAIDACIPNYVLQNITESGTEDYLASNSITTAGSSSYYNVNPEAIVNHKAGNLIHLKPGTHIKSGADYHAVIEDCNESSLKYAGEHIKTKQSSTSSNEIPKDNLEIIKIYPNPSSNNITINSTKDMQSYELRDQLNMVYNNVKENTKTLTQVALDISLLKTGIYFIEITLSDGEKITKQIIKK